MGPNSPNGGDFCCPGIGWQCFPHAIENDWAQRLRPNRIRAYDTRRTPVSRRMTTLLTTGSAHGLGLPTLFEAVALGVHLKDVNAVSETIQQGAGMRAEFCPCGSRWGYAPSGVASETFGRVLSHGLSGKAAESFVLCHVSPDALEGGLERWVGLEWLGGRRRLPYLDLAQCREGGVIGHVPMCAPVDHGRDACAREARPLNQRRDQVSGGVVPAQCADDIGV